MFCRFGRCHAFCISTRSAIASATTCHIRGASPTSAWPTTYRRSSTRLQCGWRWPWPHTATSTSAIRDSAKDSAPWATSCASSPASTSWPWSASSGVSSSTSAIFLCSAGVHSSCSKIKKFSVICCLKTCNIIRVPVPFIRFSNYPYYTSCNHFPTAKLLTSTVALSWELWVEVSLLRVPVPQTTTIIKRCANKSHNFNARYKAPKWFHKDRQFTFIVVEYQYLNIRFLCSRLCIWKCIFSQLPFQNSNDFLRPKNCCYEKLW